MVVPKSRLNRTRGAKVSDPHKREARHPRTVPMEARGKKKRCPYTGARSSVLLIRGEGDNSPEPSQGMSVIRLTGYCLVGGGERLSRVT